MTQKELDNINKAIQTGSVKLTLLKAIDKVTKGKNFSVTDIEITEYNALPVGYFLRESVREAVMLEILNDILAGEPIPSGVNLIGGETNNEQTKGPNRKSKPLSKPKGTRGPRVSGKATRPQPNSGRKNTVSRGDAKASELNGSKEQRVGRSK